MNPFMKSQIKNALLSLKTLDQSIEMAARQDDDDISREEQKQIRKIKAAIRKFEKRMNRIM